MSERTTINVSKEAHRKAQKAKEDGETWSDYLLRSTDVEAVEKDDRAELIEDIRSQLERLDDGEPESDVGFDEIMHKLEQIESAQANTVSESLEMAENDPVDYAEIESRVRRVMEEMGRR